MKTVELKKKLNEVFVVEPTDLGLDSLTEIYKHVTKYLKKLPFIVLIPLSFVISLVLYLLFGFAIVRLVSLLQYGF